MPFAKLTGPLSRVILAQGLKHPTLYPHRSGAEMYSHQCYGYQRVCKSKQPDFVHVTALKGKVTTCSCSCGVFQHVCGFSFLSLSLSTEDIAAMLF